MQAIKLDIQKAQPIYKQIRGEIMRMLHEGKLSPGSKLPTEHKIAEQFGISRGTVRQALSKLTQEGIVERFPKRGTFISIEPLDTETLSFTYILPNELSSRISQGEYSLYIQKQGGTVPHNLTFDISVDIEDGETDVSITLFPKTFDKYGFDLCEGQMLSVRGKSNLWNNRLSVIADKIDVIDI